jgi:hypothetical protein
MQLEELMSLGLEDLIRSGKSPAEAARILTATIIEPDVLTMIFDLAETEDGRELLTEWSAIWASFGLVAPWNELIALKLEDPALLGLELEDAQAFSLATGQQASS